MVKQPLTPEKCRNASSHSDNEIACGNHRGSEPSHGSEGQSQTGGTLMTLIPLKAELHSRELAYKEPIRRGDPTNRQQERTNTL
jgi:hypothetical protein